MRLSDALQIHKTVQLLKHYQDEYNRFTESYDNISGYIKDGDDWYPFKWEKNSEYYQAIVRMLENKINELKTILKNYK